MKNMSLTKQRDDAKKSQMLVSQWCSGKISDWLRGRWFKSHQDRFVVITLSKLFTLMVLRPTQPSIPPG